MISLSWGGATREFPEKSKSQDNTLDKRIKIRYPQGAPLEALGEKFQLVISYSKSQKEIFMNVL